jgi:hypothetical protein
MSLLAELKRMVDKTPMAVMMTGPNPIAPNCPQRGVFGCNQWSCTTENYRWRSEPPEGWDRLLQMEKEGGRNSLNFVIIHDAAQDRSFCVDLEDDCFTPLTTPPSEEDLKEIADYYDIKESDW